MPEPEEEEEPEDSIDDPATEQTESPGQAPTDWGLAEAQIDETLPPADFQHVRRRMEAERERLRALDEADGDDPTEADHETPKGFKESFDSWLTGLIWPLLRGFGGAVKFILGPGIGLAVLTLWAGRRGAELMEQAREEVDRAQAQLLESLSAELHIANEVASMGARDEVLRPFRERYEAAETPEDRIDAARELTQALHEELRLLPPAESPEQELARRNLELQLNELTRKHDAYDLASGRLEEQTDTPFAQVALTFDMVDE